MVAFDRKPTFSEYCTWASSHGCGVNTTVVHYEPSAEGELTPVDPPDESATDVEDVGEAESAKQHTLTRIEHMSSERYVIVADYAQSDELDPHTVRYFDRRLNVESPWGAD